MNWQEGEFLDNQIQRVSAISGLGKTALGEISVRKTTSKHTQQTNNPPLIHKEVKNQRSGNKVSENCISLGSLVQRVLLLQRFLRLCKNNRVSRKQCR